MPRIGAGLFILLILSACGGRGTTFTQLPPAVPFHTPTSLSIPGTIPPASKVIQPTPTPLIYIVVEGDTIIGIANHFGITPEALMAANPGIQAAALLVGTKLDIPAGNSTPVEPVPTPVPLPVQQAHCWMETDGGSWCFALVSNPFADTMENISAQFNLLDAGGQQLKSDMAFGLIDILPGGKSMPLVVHFPPSDKIENSVQVILLTAIRLLPGDGRYLPVTPENTLVSVDASGRTAQVSGRVILAGPGSARFTWVLASAFDVAGNVVGVRRWESSSSLSANSPLSFDFQVSSIGPVIDHVDFLAEARP
jgi:hypothetical protein